MAQSKTSQAIEFGAVSRNDREGLLSAQFRHESWIGAERKHKLISALARILPPECILVDGEVTAPYECDGLTLHRQSPMIVLLPDNEIQIAAVMSVCHAQHVPIVARGAGTGLAGSALPHPTGVLLSLSKLNRILDVDVCARTATVEPGVRNVAISEAAAPHGLFYAPDPSSQIACTIGGNVAQNAGGMHCLKYGLTLHNVLQVKGLTAAGESVEFGSIAMDAPGLDLMPLIVGSEGMLAVITEVTVKLLPKPQCAVCIMASFRNIEDAGNAVASLIAAGIIPAALEMLDQAAACLVEPFASSGYDLSAAAVLLCESDGMPQEVNEEIARMCSSLRDAGATRVLVSETEQERQRFWIGRKNVFPAAGRAAPSYYCTDGTIPRKHLATILKSIQAMEREFRLRCPNVFHAGDGNLHPLILFDDSDPDSIARAERFGARILEECLRLGGTITGEHGVGVEKLDQMCLQFDHETLDAFFGVKCAFDPTGILNPGKVIPTLRRCAEHGRMRANPNDASFPELPRY